MFAIFILDHSFFEEQSIRTSIKREQVSMWGRSYESLMSEHVFEVIAEFGNELFVILTSISEGLWIRLWILIFS